MRLQHIARFQRPSAIGAVAAALVLLVCSDGSSAGIEGSGRFANVISFGRITTSGNSISVDGVEYRLSHAQIEVDGLSGKASQLQVGQIVTVQSMVTGATSGNATNVTYTGNVIGPVSQVDVAGSELTVLGQTVKVDGTTLFGEGIPAGGLTGLAVGTSVEVSAFVAASGDLMASRIDLQSPGTALQVEGAVEDLNTGAQTFQVNGLEIDYSQASVDGQLANASTATVWADESPSAGTLHATRVQLSSGIGGAKGEQGRLAGLVTSIASSSAFDVGDQSVVTDANTHFVLHGQTLAPNLAVRVKGVFNATGALVAESVIAAPTH